MSEILKMPNDTAKVEALIEYSKNYGNINVDSATVYAQNAEALSKKLNYTRGLIAVQLVYGTFEFYKGNFPEAKELITEAIYDAEKNKYTNLIAGGKMLLGNIYAKNGEFDLALKTYREGIKVCELSNNIRTASSIYVSIGITKRMMGELDSALFYYEMVLKIQEEKLKDSVVLSSIYNNIGSTYYYKGDYAMTERYMLKALEINRLTKNTRFEIINLANLGLIWGDENGNLTKSMSYLNEAISIAKQRHSKDDLFNLYTSVADIYYVHKKYKEAFDNLKISIAYKDSVMGEAKQSQMQELEKKYGTQKIQDSLRLNQQQLEITKVKEGEALAEASRTAWQLTGALVLLLSIAVLLIYVYINSKKQKRMNLLLTEKNAEINLQKLVIEEKNIELTDSITYAKRIQTALLPSHSKLKDILGEHFLLFKPKDIVSGDFYFVKEKDGLKYFSVADCTGHGVPGAMVSMLGYESLAKISLQQLKDASVILSDLNTEMVSALSNKVDSESQSEIRDGMDIAFCVLNSMNELNFSGANNGCYIVRNTENIVSESARIKVQVKQNKQVIELVPNSRPIGYYYGNENFESICFQLAPGDVLYLFSDGFPDQFGGEKGKKLKISRFREELVKISEMKMQDQYNYLNEFLAGWQGQFDQLDDITVLGIRIQ